MVKDLMKKGSVKTYVKYFAAAMSALMMCVMLAGCMNTAGNGTNDMNGTQNGMQPQNSTQPDQQNDNMNGGSIGGDIVNGIANAPAAVFDWLTMGSSVEDRINMISEIESSRIVVNEGTALVGVTFAGQYQGEMTQRIRDMVAGEVMEADENIQAVAVTAQPEDVQKINQMADQIASGTPAQDFKSEIDSILRNVSTIQ